MRTTAAVLMVVLTPVVQSASAQAPARSDVQDVVEHAFAKLLSEAQGLSVIVIKAKDSALTSETATKLGVEHRTERDVVTCSRRCRLTHPMMAMALNRVYLEGDSAEVTVITWRPSGFERIPISARGWHVTLARRAGTWTVTKTILGPMS
jgi:hypothetical protein